MLDEDIRRFQEWETSIRLARYFRFAFVSEPTFIYDYTGADTMTKAYGSAGAAYVRIIRKHFKEILRLCGGGAWQRTSLSRDAATRWGNSG